MDRHKNAVGEIAVRVAQFHAEKRPFRIYHGGTNSTRSTTFSEDNSIDTSKLNGVISIDVQARTCLVESNVPMDVLVANTLPLGLMPPVVPEFPGITVGGAFSGTGGESTSFRHGFFDRTVNWFEMILANGDLTTASPSHEADLFYGTAGTFGTLGIITMLELRLLPAKQYVELTYTPVTSFAEAQEKMDSFSTASPPIDFIDSLMFSKTSGVVCSGTLVEYEDYKDAYRPKVVTFSRPWDQWFYLHSQGVVANQPASPTSELISLTEYLFRYDRGAFWAGRFVFEWFGVPFNWLTRILLNWLMSTRILYHGLHASGLGARYIIQDLCFPASTAEQFASSLDTDFNIYPLWLCPVVQNERISMNPHTPSKVGNGRTTGERMLNIGVWGPCPPDQDRIAANRMLEKKVRSNRGMKWLYADTYYSEEEFWWIYDHEWYEKLRQQYGASTLPTVYQKVKTREATKPWVPCDMQAVRELLRGERGLQDVWNGIWSIWPLVGVQAVWSALRKEEYLKRKR
jgi:Delta24-sterol reductase